MDQATIQSRLDALAAAMIAKALVAPDPCLFFTANSTPKVHIAWGRYRDNTNKCEVFVAETLEGAFDKADAFIAKLPSPEEAKLKQYLDAVASAVEIGKANEIETDLVNPLVATMKKLSENIITHQKAGA